MPWIGNTFARRAAWTAIAFQHPTDPGIGATPGTTVAGHGVGAGDAAPAGAASAHSPIADAAATSAARALGATALRDTISHAPSDGGSAPFFFNAPATTENGAS